MLKSSLPTSRDDRARAYLNVLFEINARLGLIKSLKLLNLPDGLAREVCYLQLRHICELMAIGCLVIQGDYKSSRSLTGEYNPQRMFRSLGRLYPRFFPQSVTITREADIIDIRGRLNPEAITREELEHLWSTTGNYLHRLKINNFFRPENWAARDIWTEIESYVAKFEALLNPHAIEMHNPNILVFASLDGDGGKPGLTFVEYGAEKADLIHYHGRGETLYWRDQ